MANLRIEKTVHDTETLAAAVAAAITGASLSTGPTRGGGEWIQVNFPGEPSAQDMTDAAAIMNGHGALALSADKAQIVNDGVDTVVVSWSGVDGVDQFDWEISTAGGSETGEDVAAPFQISFTETVVGTYLFKVQKRGTFETGFVSVEVVEA